jgi:P4 family phage/plasmid primase-like protien
MFDNDNSFAPLTANENSATQKVGTKPNNGWVPVMPVPDNVRKKPPSHKLGIPTVIWDYVDTSGHLLGAIARFDTPNGKELRPLTYCEKDGVSELRWKAMTAPRPLFALDRMAHNPTLPVLVVEGEKTAVAAQVLLPDHVVTTSPGGAQAPAKASWAHLKDRAVTVWPDNHKEGVDYAVAVSKLVLDAGAESVAIVNVPTDFPDKWDLADQLPKNWNLEGIRALINNAAVVHKSSVTTPVLSVGSDVEIARNIYQDILNQYGIIAISESRVWHYNGTHWEALTESKLRRVVHLYDGARFGKGGITKLGTGRINSILNEFMHMHDDTNFFVNTPIGINCLSGFIRFPGDSFEPELEKHSPDHRCRHVLPGNWHSGQPIAHCEESKLIFMLKGCFKDDKDIMEKFTLLGEIAGVAALGHGTIIINPKAIVLIGVTAGNGKSQVLALFRGLLPDNAISAISLGKFGDEKHVCGLHGKLLNASDELTSASAVASDAFKQIITGDPITARDVYRSTITFRPQAQHIYATNELPNFKSGMDRGVQRRLLVLTFNRTIPEEERIERIGDRIVMEETDLLLALAVSGAKRLLQQGRFTEPQSSKEALREWIYGADPVLAWLDQSARLDPSARTSPSRAYSAFKKWAAAEGYPVNTLPTINNFSARIQSSGKDITSKRTGKGGRVFVGLAVS